MAEAAGIGDIFFTVTGDIHVIRGEHFAAMKDGAIVCNSGHFNVEMDMPALARHGRQARRQIRDCVEEYHGSRTAAGSTCWPRAGWSTWPPPKATRPASWT